MSGLTVLNIPTVQTTLDPTSILYAVTGSGVFTDTQLPVSTLLANLTTPLTQAATGHFYQGQGAVVNRINDRLFVGPATLNQGTQVAIQPDWLTMYQIAKGRTYGYIQTSQFAVLNTTPNQGSLTTAVFGAQSKNGLAGGSEVIAVTGMGVNNEAIANPLNAAWGGYFEAFRDNQADGNGGAYGIEIDTMNFVSSTPVTDPYNQSADQTIGLQMASGGGFPGTLYPTTVGLNFQNNNTTYDKGIVFGSNSITGATGSSGTGIAIAFGLGHMMTWYGSAGVATSSIVGKGTTHAAGITQVFLENQVQWDNVAGQPIFQAFGVTGSINFIGVQSSTTLAPVQIVAQGTDTNIDISLVPKGNANVWLGPWTTGALGAATGYITVKDNSGNIRRLLTA